MKKIILQSLILICAFTVYSYGQTNVWKNLKPLYSTRAEVKKLLGKPADDRCLSGCDYKTEDESVSIIYADERCVGSGWNIAPNTIISITVSSSFNSGKSFDELNLNRKNFSLTVDDTVRGTWTNAGEGVQYHFDSEDRELGSITYIPKKSDNYLRCDGFPPFRPEGKHFTLSTGTFYDQKSDDKKNLAMIFGKSDSFITDVQNNKDKYKGYILVYFDNKLPFKKYQKRLDELKKHIYNRRGVAPELITFIEGGMRNYSQIEFYVLGKGTEPPAPEPTLPSPQFMKNQRK